MGEAWDILRRDGAKAAKQRLRYEQRSARLFERFDGLLAALLVALVGLAGVIGYLGSRAEDRAGMFDPNVVRPLPDPRILENFRDSDAPLLGAAALGDGAGRWALARTDGSVTLFDPDTELLQSIQMPSGPSGLGSQPRVLGAGCGFLGPGPNGALCSDPDTAFLVSADGGVIGYDGSWDVLLSDVPWIGLDGAAVEQEHVTDWAASEDGRWVAVLAGNKGLALFDEAASLWFVPSDQDVLMQAVSAGPVALIPNEGGFWLASQAGVGRLDLSTRALTLV